MKRLRWKRINQFKNIILNAKYFNLFAYFIFYKSNIYLIQISIKFIQFQVNMCKKKSPKI